MRSTTGVFAGKQLPIDFIPLSYLYNDNKKYLVLDLIEDAIPTLANAVSLLRAKLLSSGWTRVIGKSFNLLENPSNILLWDRTQVLGDRLLDLQAISCHALSDHRGVLDS